MVQQIPDEREIFNIARRLQTPEDRRTYLEQVCGDNQHLRQRITDLLRGFEEGGSFLESSPSGDIATMDVNHALEGIGQTVGPYKLCEQIGEGGMGIVFVAEQIEPVRRKVALKIIKPGMASKEVVARFEAERQALAMMNHPNIARVFDGGVTDAGLPYFVMELVQGAPITEFCDQHRLSIKQRLSLFVTVCNAVQHAHQRGVIHRDLKPSNVIVADIDADAVPKVIDFGVAKAIGQRLTEQTLYTHFSQMVGTPLYMSPEQAGLGVIDVDTRSDVYSLGVLLYELLTGCTPFDRKTLQEAGYDEMRRIIREEDPARPSQQLSTLNNELASTASQRRRITPQELSIVMRRELDWIVMKALEKDRSRRYDSAGALARDVNCYLEGTPVNACPPTYRYKLGKAIRRNTLAFGATFAIVAVFLLGALATGWQAVRATSNWKAREAALGLAGANLKKARDEQQLAEAYLKLAMQAVDEAYLESIGIERLLHQTKGLEIDSGADISANLNTLTPSEEEHLRRGLAFYDQLAKLNPSSPHASFESAKAFSRLGLIQSGLTEGHEAQLAYEQAISRLRDLSEKYPDNVEYLVELGKAYYQQGRLSLWWPQANNTFDKAIAPLSRAIESESGNAAAYELRGKCFNLLSKWTAAIADFNAVLRLDLRNHSTHHALAQLVWSSAGDDSGYDLALHHAKKSVELNPRNTSYRRRLANIYRRCFGDTPSAIAALEGALEFARDAREEHEIRVAASVIAADHTQTVHNIDKLFELGGPLVARDSALLYVDRSTAHHALGRPEDALRDLEEAEKVAASDHQWIKIGERYAALGKHEKALTALQHAEDRNRLNSRIYRFQGDILLQLGRYQDAIAAYSKYTEVLDLPLNSILAQGRARAHFELGNYAAALSDFTAALRDNPGNYTVWYSIARTRIVNCPDESFRDGLIDFASELIADNEPSGYFGRGRLFARMGRSEEALNDLQRCVELLSANVKNFDDRIRLSNAYESRGEVFEEIGKFEQAIQDYSQCTSIDAGSNGLYRRSRLYLRLGRYDLAFQDLHDLIEIEPSYAGNWNKLALLLATWPDERKRNAEKAVEYAKRAVDLVPQFAGFHSTLGIALYRTGDWQAAIKALSKSEEMWPGQNVAFNGFFLAMSNWKVGRKTEAQEWYDRAITWMSENAKDDEQLIRFRNEAQSVMRHQHEDQTQTDSSSEESQP